MDSKELATLKAEIATNVGTIRNLRHHAEQLSKEAAELETATAALKSKLPAEPEN